MGVGIDQAGTRPDLPCELKNGSFNDARLLQSVIKSKDDDITPGFIVPRIDDTPTSLVFESDIQQAGPGV